MSFTVSARGVEVPDDVRRSVTDDDVAARLARKDATLWGPDAEHEASIRLGWLDLPSESRELVGRLADLRRGLLDEGLDRVVLCGMGGSSLAPEVICRTADVPLVVLDGTDPGQVAAAMEHLERTVVVVSSKSGGTVETDSHRRAFLAAFEKAGVDEPGRRFVVVTDPGSPLESTAREMGAREVFLADPNVGGRYSALSAFGLVPSALAGADVGALLDQAEELSGRLAEDGNPALELGLVLGAGFAAGRDKVALADGGSGITGFGDWAEQLIAESTGKQGRGLLPVVLEATDAPGSHAPDALLAVIGGEPAADHASVAVGGELGAQFLGWEYAVAVAGKVIGINPFDQPNVTESKENTKKILATGMPKEHPVATVGAVQVFAEGLLDDVEMTGDGALRAAVDALLATIPEHGYLAVMAYLDREHDASAADLREALAEHTRHEVTFGWGPRFLHSTGQYHKGGPQVGAFLQITGTPTGDLDVPGEDYTFASLQAAQAAGDRQALADRSRPLLHLHLTDRSAGLGELLEALA